MNIEELNEFYKAGHAVIVTDDFGKEHQTVTTSIAWDLCGTPVIRCEGFGTYDLDRVKFLEQQ